MVTGTLAATGALCQPAPSMRHFTRGSGAVGDVIHFAEGPATVAHVRHEDGRVRLRLSEGSLSVPPDHRLLVSRPPAP